MKYTVELKYINPSHEHVSLRRRVDTVTRLVEASSEQEAINRAANQQRALGFMIKEASVVKPEVIKEEVERVTEGKVSGYKMYRNPDNTWYVEDEDEGVVLRNASQGEAEHMVWSGNQKLKGVVNAQPATRKKIKNRMEEVEQVDEAEREAGYKMSPAVKAAQAKSDALSKVAKRPQAGTLAAQKAKKAADKMVNKAKKNKTVNLEPSIEAGKPDA